MTRYNATVLDHYRRPRNLAPLAQATHEGRAGAPLHGDFVVLRLAVAAGVITRCQIRVFGCPAAIATASAFSEMIRGRTLDQARALTREDVARFLGGLPEGKLQCSTLAPDALRAAAPAPKQPQSR